MGNIAYVVYKIWNGIKHPALTIYKQLITFQVKGALDYVPEDLKNNEKYEYSINSEGGIIIEDKINKTIKFEIWPDGHTKITLKIQNDTLVAEAEEFTMAQNRIRLMINKWSATKICDVLGELSEKMGYD